MSTDASLSSAATSAATSAPAPPPEECTLLYKILTPSEHAALPAEGRWLGTSLDLKDGFIHLSTSHQLPGTLSRFFTKEICDDEKLYILALPRDAVDVASLKFEEAAGTRFGHVYGGVVPSKDFVETRTIKRDAQGVWNVEAEQLPF